MLKTNYFIILFRANTVNAINIKTTVIGSGTSTGPAELTAK
ncbi:hypothetical protein CPS_2632 [Colwellia psychrerythraea 34H]|uniref:Uncharacterized protein n=1 Tax=Colwellia psychrerythraea (strain 34H / ATCC BAA-681) TaxID=167879 RepID=Q481C3_COLP3|nr:hypothetical protein CPS_2632 [Colwellia psychrerythraea 34H]